MDKLPEIIGIAGPNGSGKDTLGDLRFKRQGIPKASLSDILRVEADKRGLSHERSNLGAIGKEWAGLFGAAALVVMTLRNYEETKEATTPGISLVSIRRTAEAQAIRDAGGTLLWIDAARELRYQRILEANRGRVTDEKTFEEFCAEEDREMSPSSDSPFEMNMAGVRDMADIHLRSEFSSKEEHEQYLIDRFGL